MSKSRRLALLRRLGQGRSVRTHLCDARHAGTARPVSAMCQKFDGRSACTTSSSWASRCARGGHICPRYKRRARSVAAKRLQGAVGPFQELRQLADSATTRKAAVCKAGWSGAGNGGAGVGRYELAVLCLVSTASTFDDGVFFGITQGTGMQRSLVFSLHR